jgi:hypothetical protein
MPLTLKEMIQPDKQVRFVFYCDMTLWYATDDGFEFPVPIDDIGNATFHDTDKAILFMRYIRKHLETLEAAREARL